MEGSQYLSDKTMHSINHNNTTCFTFLQSILSNLWKAFNTVYMYDKNNYSMFKVGNDEKYKYRFGVCLHTSLIKYVLVRQNALANKQVLQHQSAQCLLVLC